MPKGKAESVDYLNSVSRSNDPSNEFEKGNVINRKKILRDFSSNIIVQSIIRTRQNQVLKYARPASQTTDGVGFKIVPKVPSDTMTAQQNNHIRELEEFIYNTGEEWTPQRHNFPRYLSQFIHDKYIFDQINTERVFKKGSKTKLSHFNAVDAGTILIKDLPKSMDVERVFEQQTSVEHRGKPKQFTENELTFITYHNDGEVTRKGYGFSEVEASLSHLGYHSDTEQFNARFFAQGGTTRGLLVIDPGGSVQQNSAALASLRRQWQASFSGVNGAWKIPVLSGHSADYVNMTQSSKDMEFEKWLNYLINVISSIFQIQPDEINFPNRGGSTGKGTGSSINEGSTAKTKMQQSQDKGLQPLLNDIEDFINDQILRYVDDKYLFRFTVGDAKTEQEHLNAIKTKLDNGMTTDEARKAMDLPALGGDFTRLPGGPSTVVQFLQFEQSQDEASQFIQQHKNDSDPSKASNNDPKDAMPSSAINGKTKHQEADNTVETDEGTQGIDDA